MTEKIIYCPRAIQSGGGPDGFRKPPFDGAMTWREDDSCSYCGSLNPDTFMTRLEAGDVELTPTDKSYKVYIGNRGGAQFKQTYRDCPPGSAPHMPDECDHWVTREVRETKFYFQHLSIEQRARFIELYNAGRIHMVGGGFYVLPFFCSRG